jgi:hypothetical protein
MDFLIRRFSLSPQRGCSTVLKSVSNVRSEVGEADERLAEIAEILADGLTRLRARQSSLKPADAGESSLDCAGQQSGHANVLTDGGME